MKNGETKTKTKTEITEINPTSNKPIEYRACSAAFLRLFSKLKVTPALNEIATIAGIEYLEKEIKKHTSELKAHRFISNTPLVTQPLLATTFPSYQQSSPKQLEETKRHLSQRQYDLSQRQERNYMSTRDVNKYIVKGETDAKRCRYLELDEWANKRDPTTNALYFGRVDHFVSHNWDSPWDAMVDAICDHSDEQEGDPYYWVDIFAVIQHWKDTEHCTKDSACPGCMAVTEDMPDWKTMQTTSGGFKQVISASPHTLILMEPWHRPRPPTRVWCLYESYVSLMQPNGSLEVVLSKLQQRDMQRNLRYVLIVSFSCVIVFRITHTI